MTKFGRILCLMRKWRKKCSPLQVKVPLSRRPGDEVELFWLWKKKMADISLVSRVRTTAETRRSNSYKHSKNSKKTTRRATSAIWGIFAELDKPKRTLWRWTEHRGIDGGKHVLAMFLFKTRNYFEWIIKQLLNSAFLWYDELWRSRRVNNSLLNLHNSS